MSFAKRSGRRRPYTQESSAPSGSPAIRRCGSVSAPSVTMTRPASGSARELVARSIQRRTRGASSFHRTRGRRRRRCARPTRKSERSGARSAATAPSSAPVLGVELLLHERRTRLLARSAIAMLRENRPAGCRGSSVCGTAALRNQRGAQQTERRAARAARHATRGSRESSRRWTSVRDAGIGEQCRRDRARPASTTTRSNVRDARRNSPCSNTSGGYLKRK